MKITKMKTKKVNDISSSKFIFHATIFAIKGTTNNCVAEISINMDLKVLMELNFHFPVFFKNIPRSPQIFEPANQ